MTNKPADPSFKENIDDAVNRDVLHPDWWLTGRRVDSDMKALNRESGDAEYMLNEEDGDFDKEWRVAKVPIGQVIDGGIAPEPDRLNERLQNIRDADEPLSRPLYEMQADGRLSIIDGWHRLQISKERGEKTIDALVCRLGYAHQESARFQSIDQRLDNSRQIATYMAKFAGNRSFSQEVAEDYFHGAAATVTRFAIVDLIEGQPDGNERNLAKEKRYIAMDAETSPPIVVEDGNVMDGNHRLRAAKARGDLYILGYDVHDETERPAPHKGPLNAKDEATKNEISTHSDLKKAADALDFLDSLTAKKKSILDLP